MKFLIVFYTKEDKPPELFREGDMGLLFNRIIDLTKKKTLFCIYKVGECVGDYS